MTVHSLFCFQWPLYSAWSSCPLPHPCPRLCLALYHPPTPAESLSIPLPLARHLVSSIRTCHSISAAPCWRVLPAPSSLKPTGHGKPSPRGWVWVNRQVSCAKHRLLKDARHLRLWKNKKRKQSMEITASPRNTSAGNITKVKLCLTQSNSSRATGLKGSCLITSFWKQPNPQSWRQ